MKYKLAITSGVILWIVITGISIMLYTYIVKNDISYITLLLPISIIILTSIFTIIYIRNFNSNELLEGIKLGIVFIIINFIGDYILLFLLIRFMKIPLFPTYPLEMVFFILLATTFIGYLAQMPVELR